MKIIGIVSSPSYEGNTAVLVREALQGAKKNGAEIEELFLPQYNLKFCKGCLKCLEAGRCSIPDDLETLRDKLNKSDGIIIGSPTYGLEPNAIMKNFLDRIGLYTVYSSALGEKYVAGISTAGAAGSKTVAKKITGIVDGFFKSGYVVDYLGVNKRWDRIEEYPQYMQKANELGKKMVNDIKNKRKYPFKKVFSKILSKIVIGPVMKKNILEFKDSKMKAVYEYAQKMGYIK